MQEGQTRLDEIRQPAIHESYDPKTGTNQVEEHQIRKHTYIQEVSV